MRLLFFTRFNKPQPEAIYVQYQFFQLDQALN